MQLLTHRQHNSVRCGRLKTRLLETERVSWNAPVMALICKGALVLIKMDFSNSEVASVAWFNS